MACEGEEIAKLAALHAVPLFYRGLVWKSAGKSGRGACGCVYRGRKTKHWCRSGGFTRKRASINVPKSDAKKTQEDKQLGSPAQTLPGNQPACKSQQYNRDKHGAKKRAKRIGEKKTTSEGFAHTQVSSVFVVPDGHVPGDQHVQEHTARDHVRLEEGWEVKRRVSKCDGRIESIKGKAVKRNGNEKERKRSAKKGRGKTSPSKARGLTKSLK